MLERLLPYWWNHHCIEYSWIRHFLFIIHQIFTKETFKRRKVNLFSHGAHETVAIGDDGWKKKYFSIHGGYGRASYDKRTQITIRQVMEYGIRRCIDKYPFIPIRKRKIKFRRNDKLPFCYNRSLSPLEGIWISWMIRPSCLEIIKWHSRLPFSDG